MDEIVQIDGGGYEFVRTFLSALFADVDGLHEIRVIEDRKGGDFIERRWYEASEELVQDLAGLNDLAGSRAAGIFLGVLPRARKSGKTEDVGRGAVVWVDLDFKDYAEGEDEARGRLAEFPFEPSVVVFSGHGLHAYWLLREAEEPKVLSNLSRGVGQVLGGDNTHDATRLLRLPGTFNYKDPSAPIATVLEVLEVDRRYNASELEDALDTCGWNPTDAASAEPIEVVVAERMSDRVLALLDTNKRVSALFNGTGKPAVGADGRRLDATNSGYDFSFVLELARLGVDDASELATALSCRPDGVAREKGQAYLARTVANALDRADNASEAITMVVDFDVERVRILASDRSTYELTIGGHVLSLTSAQLRSKSSFATRYLELIHRVPLLPTKADDWRAFVNGLLVRAEVVELGQDASESAALREDVERAVQELQQGDELEDLERGQYILTDGGKRAFRVDPLLRHLQEQRADLTRHGLCAVLTDLGHSSGTHRVRGKVVRLWV